MHVEPHATLAIYFTRQLRSLLVRVSIDTHPHPMRIISTPRSRSIQGSKHNRRFIDFDPGTTISCRGRQPQFRRSVHAHNKPLGICFASSQGRPFLLVFLLIRSQTLDSKLKQARQAKYRAPRKQLSFQCTGKNRRNRRHQGRWRWRHRCQMSFSAVALRRYWASGSRVWTFQVHDCCWEDIGVR